MKIIRIRNGIAILPESIRILNIEEAREHNHLFVVDYYNRQVGRYEAIFGRDDTHVTKKDEEFRVWGIWNCLRNTYLTPPLGIRLYTLD